MSEWKKVKIGDFLKRKRIPVVLDETAKYKLLTVRLYHKGIVLREEKLGALIKSNMFKVSKGDFILSGIDARNGAFGIVPEELDGAVVTNDFWYFDIDESIIKREYFLWLTTTPIFLDACQKASKGETQRIRLQKEAFFNYEINCPTIDYQDEFLSTIASVIDNINELKKEKEKQTELVKQLRTNILQDAIEGKLTADWREKHPVKKGDPDYDAETLFEKIQNEKQEKGKKQSALPIITKEEKTFVIPNGWKWTRLGEISSIVRGGSPRPAGDKKYYDGNIPFLKVGDLTNSNLKELWTYTYTIKEAGLTKTRYVEKETLMLTNSGATLGVPKICMIATTFNDGIAAFLGLKDRIIKDFLYYFLKSKTEWFLKEAARGQGQPNLNTDIIALTILPLPPLAEQNEIVARVEKHLEAITQLETQIATRETLTKQLMQGLLKDAFEER